MHTIAGLPNLADAVVNDQPAVPGQDRRSAAANFEPLPKGTPDWPADDEKTGRRDLAEKLPVETPVTTTSLLFAIAFLLRWITVHLQYLQWLPKTRLKRASRELVVLRPLRLTGPKDVQARFSFCAMIFWWCGVGI
jgi:hypothetical protein